MPSITAENWPRIVTDAVRDLPDRIKANLRCRRVSAARVEVFSSAGAKAVEVEWRYMADRRPVLCITSQTLDRQIAVYADAADRYEFSLLHLAPALREVFDPA